MSLVQDEHGSFTHADDPGEPQTGVPRVSVTEKEADLLEFLADGLTVLEIGTGLGVSTKALERSALNVVTVDPDPWVHQHIWPQLGLCTVKATAPDHERVRDFVFGFELVFIDGDHDPEALARDLATARSYLERGVIVVHDTNAPHIRLTCIDTGWDWTFVNTHHGLGISYVGWDE